MNYLYYFYAFLASVSSYFLIIQNISIPNISSTTDLLPYYSSYSFPQTHKLGLYFLALVWIPFMTVALGFLCQSYANLQSANHPRGAWNKLPWGVRPVKSLMMGMSWVISFSGVIFILYKGIIGFVNIPDILRLYPFLGNPIFFLFGCLSIYILLFWYFHPRSIKPFATTFTRGPLANGFGKALVIVFIFLIIITLFDRTMDEKDIFIGRTFQYSHSAVFVGPVFDILHGKAMLADADAQYGLLINFVPALFFKFLTPLSFTNFFYLMIGYGIFYYITLFALLKKKFQNIYPSYSGLQLEGVYPERAAKRIRRVYTGTCFSIYAGTNLSCFSILWASLGITTLFSFHFYLISDRYLRPMFFPIRYILDIPFFLLLFSFSFTRPPLVRLILPLYLAFAILYNYETGLALSVSYLLYTFLYSLTLSQTSSWKEKLFLITREAAKLFVSLGLFVILYSLYTFYMTGKIPDWPRALFFIRLFGNGFIASNGPRVSFYLFTLAIYLVVVIKTILSIINKTLTKEGAFDGALTFYGLCIFIYYVERSYPPNLPAVSLPAIILGISLFREITGIVSSSKDSIMKKSLFAPYIVLGCFMMFGIIFYPFRLAANRTFPYWAGDKTASKDLYEKIVESEKAFTKYEPGQKRLTVISFFDTLLTLHLGKVNSLPYTSFQNIFTRTQVNNVLKSITDSRPGYIYTNGEDGPENIVYKEIFEYISKHYRLVETIGALNVWEKI